MTNVEQIQNFYTSENFRNLKLVDVLFHDDVVIEWNSTIGFFKYNKEDVMKFSKELYENYVSSNVEIITIFGEGNEVVVRYNYFASTIENPTEMILITQIMVIWEFRDGKIIKGYQCSHLG